jgi:hypothetical protein
MLACLMLAVAPASAHRMPGSLTTIKKNPTSGTIEVIHRLHTHDAELGMMTVLNDRTVTLDALADRARLALYVEERFVVAGVVDGERGRPLPLELIGAEVDGEFVLVFQEYAGPLPAVVAVRDDILRDVFPGQINHVNIAIGGTVHSVTFQGDDEWQTTRVD